MQILFSFAGGDGHFRPLVPLAKAAIAAGHKVLFTGRGAMQLIVEDAGFIMFASGMDYGYGQERQALMPVNMEIEDRGLRDFFGDRLARTRANSILELAPRLHAELIVCDEVDFGAMIAAEKLGIPYAVVNVIAAGSFLRQELLTETLNKLRADYGLAPDPDLKMLSRYLVLSPVPPSFREPAYPLPETAFSYRPFEMPSEKKDIASRDSWGRPYTPPKGLNESEYKWIAELEKPLIYFTLGTVFNRESGDLFERAIRALSDLPFQVVVTLGQDIKVSEFGEVASNIHLAQYIPQAFLLPHCTMVISHGGSGSLMGALAHGLPSVLLPMGADQPLNAKRSEALGFARALDVVSATPEMIREAVMDILETPSYRLAAETMRDEILALPMLDEALERLEDLVK